MGDQGCCCIDEFDKMSSTEHQVVPCTMRARTLTHTHMDARMLTLMCDRPRGSRTAPTHTRPHAHAHAHAHTRPHAHVHSCTYAHMHMHMHMHMHTYTHTHR